MTRKGNALTILQINIINFAVRTEEVKIVNMTPKDITTSLWYYKQAEFGVFKKGFSPLGYQIPKQTMPMNIGRASKM